MRPGVDVSTNINTDKNVLVVKTINIKVNNTWIYDGAGPSNPITSPKFPMLKFKSNVIDITDP